MVARVLFFIVLSCGFVQGQSVVWTQVQPGIWKGTVGKPEVYNLLTAAGTKPNAPALTRLGLPTSRCLNQPS